MHVVALDQSVVAAAGAVYQEQVLSYKHLLDECRFVFECTLVGNLQAFTAYSWSLSCSETL